MFQRAGATEEKALLLNPTRQNSLTDGVCSMPLLLAQGQSHPTVTWIYVIKRFINNKQHLELDLDLHYSAVWAICNQLDKKIKDAFGVEEHHRQPKNPKPMAH